MSLFASWRCRGCKPKRLSSARFVLTRLNDAFDRQTETMPTLHPKTPKDLLLAPLAAHIDMNLQEIRDLPPAEIEDELALRLNLNIGGAARDTRAAWVLEYSLWQVDMHDWHAEITDDSARLRLTGGSVTLDIGLSATLLEYIEHGH
jgi:hypothetical protein